MLVMDEETTPDEDKVFYMDPGFAVPEYSDLLELDADTGNASADGEDRQPAEQPEEDKVKVKRFYSQN